MIETSKIVNKLKDRNVRMLLLFVCSLVVFNIAFLSAGGWTRLFWNTLGYVVLFAVYKAAQLDLGAIGLSRNKLLSGLKYGLGVIAVIAAGMLLVFFADKTIFQDSRYQQSLTTAIYSVLIYLPLKTVLFEEITFRGILPALALKIKNQQTFAAVVSSVIFGFWHVISAVKMGEYHVGSVTVPNFLVVLVVFIATTTAGYLFYQLRAKSGSLLAPILVHWFLNAFGIILAYFALR